MLYQYSKAHKLQIQWVRPQKIVKKLSNTNYVIQEVAGKKQTLVYANLIKPYYDKTEFVAMTFCQSGEIRAEIEIPELLSGTETGILEY